MLDDGTHRLRVLTPHLPSPTSVLRRLNILPVRHSGLDPESSHRASDVKFPSGGVAGAT